MKYKQNVVHCYTTSLFFYPFLFLTFAEVVYNNQVASLLFSSWNLQYARQSLFDPRAGDYPGSGSVAGSPARWAHYSLLWVTNNNAHLTARRLRLAFPLALFLFDDILSFQHPPIRVGGGRVRNVHPHLLVQSFVYWFECGLGSEC